MNTVYVNQSTEDKLRILADAAKYDVACTSSGVDRKGESGKLGNSVACGICHSFSSDGRCISLLKVLMTNHCIFDCKYCLNRASNDVPRAIFEPEELCRLVIEFYKRNYIEGLFLSSGVVKSPAYTMELICQTLHLLRTKYHFNGYIHVKTIPGAPDEYLALAGFLADRISINLELPTAESLKLLAPHKSFKNILEPMGKVSDTIAAHRLAIGKDARMERSQVNDYLSGSIFNKQNLLNEATNYNTSIHKTASQANEPASNSLYVPDSRIADSKQKADFWPEAAEGSTLPKKETLAVDSFRHSINTNAPALLNSEKLKRPFAPAGQSTQMIIGATDETDLALIKTSQSLYQGYDLKRVFYSAYIPINEDNNLPALGTPPPLLREHRLYQADWLLRYYGFQAEELLTEANPFFNDKLDPKCDWAIRHLEQFPVEVQTASYDMLMRIPGIGPKSAKRIMQSRRYGKLSFDALKRMGVVLKRAHYFLLCNGKMMYHIPIEEKYITAQLVDMNQKENWQISHQNENYKQLTIWDMMNQVV